jgi:hypothetical protein
VDVRCGTQSSLRRAHSDLGCQHVPDDGSHRLAVSRDCLAIRRGRLGCRQSREAAICISSIAHAPIALRNFLVGGLQRPAIEQQLLELLDLYRQGNPDEACQTTFDWLLNGKIRAGSVWDALFLTTAELVTRYTWVGSKMLAGHSITCANALHFIFRNVSDPATRLYALLEAVEWTTSFLNRERARPALRDRDLFKVTPAALSKMVTRWNLSSRRFPSVVAASSRLSCFRKTTRHRNSPLHGRRLTRTIRRSSAARCNCCASRRPPKSTISNIHSPCSRTTATPARNGNHTCSLRRST